MNKKEIITLEVNDLVKLLMSAVKKGHEIGSKGKPLLMNQIKINYLALIAIEGDIQKVETYNKSLNQTPPV